jgi:arylsulfatase A-like enzyme
MLCRIIILLIIFHVGHGASTAAPNILLIVADDLGYNELGFMNNTRGILSPHLDSLASNGVTLKNHYSQPICSPTRSAMMTGRYPLALGTQSNVIYWDTPWSPSLDNKFLPQYFQDLNYTTAMFGKWHLGMHKEATTPWKRGFDHHAGYLQGCGSGWTHVSSCCQASSTPTKDQHYVCPHEDIKFGNKDYRAYDWFTNGEPDITANGTRTAELMRKHVTTFLSNRSERPFFLYLPFQNIHGPYDAPLTFVNLYQNRSDLTENEITIFAYISEMDSVIGTVINKLHELNEYDNTLIVFLSDNGAPNVKQVRNRNYPLRGFKTQIWEGGVKTPAFVSGGVLPKQVRGTISHELYHVTDWLPTILNVVGIDVKINGGHHIDGLNSWKSISQGLRSPREEMVYNVNPLCTGGQAGPPKAGFRKKINGTNYKILTYCYSVANKGGNSNFTGPIIPSSFPPSNWPKHFNGIMLFDLDNDPSETNDISNVSKDVVNALLKRLSEYAVLSVEPMQWVKPYQGKDYECADCPLRKSNNNPNQFWTPWIKNDL